MKKIQKLFADVGIGDVELIEKIEVGFANDVYSIDDEYIFKGYRFGPKVLYKAEQDKQHKISIKGTEKNGQNNDDRSKKRR